MAQERLDMRKVYEIFKMHFEQNQAPRAIAKQKNARTMGRGRRTIQEYIGRAVQAGLILELCRDG